MNAKIIFGIVDSFKEGNFTGFSVYSIKNEYMSESEERYRVDCGDKGSFEISRLDGSEEYCIKTDQWIFTEGTIYSFTCLSTTYMGYPIITMLDFIKISGMRQYNVIKDYRPVITHTGGITKPTKDAVINQGDVLTQMGKNDTRFASTKDHYSALYEYTLKEYNDCFKLNTY